MDSDPGIFLFKKLFGVYPCRKDLITIDLSDALGK